MSANPSLGEPLAAQVVAVARERHDPELLALSLRALAWAQRVRLDNESARRLLDEAVRVSRSADIPSAEALARVSRAAVLQELGRVTAARRDLDAALVAVARVEDDEGSAEALATYATFQRAVIDQNAGSLTAAEESYRTLLGHPDLTEQLSIKVANNLALIEAQRGVYEMAQKRVAEAVERATPLGPVVLAPIVQSRAWIAVQAGRLAEGLRHFETAAAVYAAAELSLGEHYAEYADVMTDLRLLPEAAAAATRAVQEFDAAGTPLMGAEAQLRVARIAMLTGDHETAVTASAAAAELLQRQTRSGWRDRAILVGVESRLGSGRAGEGEFAAARRAAARLDRAGNLPSAVEAYLVAGRVALVVGRRQQARSALARAATLAKKGTVLVRIRGRLAAALAARSVGDDSGALAECRAGIRDLATHRSVLPTMELQALASGHGAELGEIGLGVVARQGSPARLLAWMERTRAAALTRFAPRTSEGMAELRAAHAPATETQPSRNSAAAMVSEEIREQESRIRAASWKADAPTPLENAEPDPPARMGDLRDLLDGRILVEYARLEGRILAVLIDPRRARIVDLGPERDVVEQVRALVFALRRLANPRGPAAAAAARTSADLRVERLRSILLEPLGVAPDSELVVVPVGPLHGVPWSALHAGPVALAPSATFWTRTRRAALERPGTVAGTDDSTTVLIAGPELAGAHEEVETLRAVHPSARVLGPRESRADDVIDALRTAELGHLACHGWLRADNPMFSALILADGPVTVQEMHTAGVAPHRLVLASCHSGADVAYAGDEVIGFVSAVLAQGTAGVVASIAAIPDVAAVDLMFALHRGIAAGQTLARALHHARAEIDRDSPEGYVNWCTFSAHGAA